MEQTIEEAAGVLVRMFSGFEDSSLYESYRESEGITDSEYRERGSPGQRGGQHKGKTWRWGKRDPADTAQTVEEWMRINKGSDEHGQT